MEIIKMLKNYCDLERTILENVIKKQNTHSNTSITHVI